MQGPHVMDHHHFWGKAFLAGLRAHAQPTVEACDADWREDLAVFWGHNRPELIQQVKAAGGHYLVMERGYVGNRYEHTSLGFDGLNGRATFPGRDGAPPDRWQALRRLVTLRVGERRSATVLIAGQVAGDASLRGLSLRDWYEQQVAEARALGLRPLFRPHPESRHWDGPDGCDVSFRPLEADLADALAVVTFNSNLGVDAALAGCAVIATDEGSMARAIAGAQLDAATARVEATARPAFQQWCYGLAYCQWTYEEIAGGVAWDHLRSFYEPAPHG